MHPSGYIQVYLSWDSGGIKLEISTTDLPTITTLTTELKAIQPKTTVYQDQQPKGANLPGIARFDVRCPVRGIWVGLWIIARLNDMGWEVFQSGSRAIDSWTYDLRLTA